MEKYQLFYCWPIRFGVRSSSRILIFDFALKYFAVRQFFNSILYQCYRF